MLGSIKWDHFILGVMVLVGLALMIIGVFFADKGQRADAFIFGLTLIVLAGIGALFTAN